jgi:hypothetical protein
MSSIMRTCCARVTEASVSSTIDMSRVCSRVRTGFGFYRKLGFRLSACRSNISISNLALMKCLRRESQVAELVHPANPATVYFKPSFFPAASREIDSRIRLACVSGLNVKNRAALSPS